MNVGDFVAASALTWTLHIPMKPPNMNSHVVNRAGGKSRAVKQAFAAQAAIYRRAREQWTLMIRNQKQLVRCPDATGKRRITYTRVMGPREREWDEDNLVGGGKMVFDAMVSSGLLVDDKPALCEREYLQIRGAASALRLEVTEL